jgi:hypothetical protein
MRTNLSSLARSDLNQNISTSEQKTKGSSFLRGIKSLFSKNKTATDSSIDNAEKKLSTQKSGGEKAAKHVSTTSNQTVNIRSLIPTSFTLPPTDVPPPLPPTDIPSPPPGRNMSPPPPIDLPPPPPKKTNIEMTSGDLKNNTLIGAINEGIKTGALRKSEKNALVGEINNAIPFEKLKLSKDHKNYGALNKKMIELQISIQTFAASAVQDNSTAIKITDNKMQGLKNDLIEDFSAALMLTTNNPIANHELTKAQESLAALLDNVLATRGKDPWE